MEKAEVCSDCGKNPCECEKKSEDGNDKEPDADEDDKSMKKEIKKSIWGGAFSPFKK